MKTRLTFLLAAASALAQPPGGGPGRGATGDGIWRRNAAYGESQTFDACFGHQPGNGDYHYHVNPVCLRAQLNDNVVAVKNSRVGTTYREQTSGWHHSPILGWAQDGYPIYGPYGYSDPKNAQSPIKRMVSSYQLRGITTRTMLPAWSLPNHSGISQQLSPGQYGPPVSAAYPLGRYLEDYEYIQGLGDLDQYNGRTTATPEFPNGTYAYFVTIDDQGNPAFPYILGGQYYGAATAGQAQNIPGALTDYFNNGTRAQNSAATPELASWATAYSTKFAQIVSGLNPAAGPLTTWPGNAPVGIQTSGSVLTPTYAEIQRIRYSATSVYVNTNGLPG
ncbi:MAG: YHYH protein, partial [Acidobacteriota bacterium]|nr:YHYH protein [Acidobacteriota bacterium]